ncbi:MAG: NAD(P)/FAD-dependent oxidoreductase [Betaproteobacteria bacterium]|nr:NAD(P)/FAD-dependent oxidoreductase [Betaproteobacteria bacterium]
MTEKIDCVVIGAGVVGLAVARAMQMRGRETIVLEAERSIGTGTSSRNSEVIHAGIYYAKDSLKARFCVEGRDLLYRYCREHGVAHKNIGKFIVATAQDQVATLEKIMAAAKANGVEDLRFISLHEVREREPQLHCLAALESPSSGIVDSHGLMLSLQGDLESAGGVVALGSPVLSARCSNARVAIEVGGDEPMTLEAAAVINCAGLNAPVVARKSAGLPPALVPPNHFTKGNYYSLTGRSPFSRLIYPVPVPGGLGVHVTLDLAGQTRFGPDVEVIDSIGYDVDPARADAFYAEIRKYWPGLPDGALQPAYSGIRPKLGTARYPYNDFLIQGPGEHGVHGLVNLFGIESPGLTASLAIADYVGTLLPA